MCSLRVSQILRRTYSVLICLVLASTAAAQADADANESKPKADAKESIKLFIGDKAPDLSIAKWLDNPNKAPQITKFKEGNVYIIGFWSTSCDPCVIAMPHLAELQKKYGDQGLQVINVTDDDPKRVDWFLDRKNDLAKDSPAKTYAELVRGFSVGIDPDSSTNKAYLEAAGQSGIPTSFLIGKKGMIEWIGHPMVVDDPLAEVIKGTWDSKAFVTEYRERRQVTETMMSVTRKMRSGLIDEAVEVLDAYLKEGTIEAEKERFRTMKLRILASSRKHADDAAEFALELLGRDDLDASRANDLAWSIYKMAETGDFEDQDVLIAALELTTEKASNAGDLKPYILDTVAHLQHFTGDHEEAYKTQKRAFRLCKDDEKAEFKEYLDELEALQAAVGNKK